MADNIFSLPQGKSSARYTVERAIIEAKNGDKQRFLVLDDGMPASVINKHLLIKQERQARPASTPAYNLCLFLNDMDKQGIEMTNVTYDHIFNYIYAAYIMEEKTYQTITSYIYNISALYENLALHDCPLDKSLLRLTADGPAAPRIKRRGRERLTKVCMLLTEFVPKDSNSVRTSYTKWYSVDEIKAIAEELTLAYRCIFYDTIFTGHRVDSTLSVKLDSVNLQNRRVCPTRTKTGQMHISEIPSFLADLMQTYLIEERPKIVASTGSTSPYFFLGKNGLPVSYSAYNTALKRAGKRASEKSRSPH